MPKVSSSAFSHEQHLVKQLHDLAAGLVDGADHSPALAGQAPQHLHHTGGHEAVQARGGLITKQDGRVGQNLGSKRQSFHLSARDALDTLVGFTNYCVSTFQQPKLWKEGELVFQFRFSTTSCSSSMVMDIEILTSLIISSTLLYRVFFGMFASILTRA